MENIEIARILDETADLMEINGEDGFRIRSYRNAASAIESYPERIEDLLATNDRSVTEIPGVGKGIAAVLAEVVKRGSFDRRDDLLSKYPPTALELLRVPGLGPKRIRDLWDHFRVSTIDDLERVCRDQKLRELPRMGAKLEEKILNGIAGYRQRAGRYLLNFGMKVSDEISGFLSAVEGVAEVTPAGSLRRGRETIGDLDILLTGPDPVPALDVFAKHPKVIEVLGQGENKTSVRFGLESIQVDLRALPIQSYGAALQYFTGSKHHNVLLRNRAIRKGLTLNEYGLFQVEGEKRIGGATEEEIYAELGLDWIPPEIRENAGEFEAAEQHTLPNLIQLPQIRGDLHMHTIESDGRASFEEMAEAAAAKGYEYIAITDHSKSLAMANGLDEKRAVEMARKIRQANRDGLPIRLLSGIECDILRDGSMDLSNDALAELDIVVGSVHSYMQIESEEMTGRLLKALECPYVKILGHPTGRMLLRREGFLFDFESVADSASKFGVALEINSGPERLDLPPHLVRSAKGRGNRFVISSDAHHPRQLEYMRLGVKTARRGWLESQDVLNTLPLDQLLDALRPTA